MSLQNILQKIENLKPFLDEDVDSGPVETLTARRGRKRNAEEEIVRLKDRYVHELMRSAVFILVSGEEASKFAEVASSDTFQCFSADPEEIYKSLADTVHPQMYSGSESAASLFDMVSRGFEIKANELGILEYPMLTFKQEYRRAISGKEDFVELLKVAVTDQIGGELVGVQAVYSIVDSAIARGHKESVTPIVLPTNDSAFAEKVAKHLTRLTTKVFSVHVGSGKPSGENVISVKDADEKSVDKALKTVRKYLKN